MTTYIEKKIELHRLFMIAEINSLFSKSMSEMLKTYPSYEVATFDQQKTEANNLTGATPIIDQISITKGVPREAIAGRILGKASLFAVYSGMYLAVKQKVIEQIEVMDGTDVLLFDYKMEWNKQIQLGFARIKNM